MHLLTSGGTSRSYPGPGGSAAASAAGGWWRASVALLLSKHQVRSTPFSAIKGGAHEENRRSLTASVLLATDASPVAAPGSAAPSQPSQPAVAVAPGTLELRQARLLAAAAHQRADAWPVRAEAVPARLQRSPGAFGLVLCRVPGMLPPKLPRAARTWDRTVPREARRRVRETAPMPRGPGRVSCSPGWGKGPPDCTSARRAGKLGLRPAL